MLDLLVRILGPDRGVSAYVFLSRFWVAIVGVAAMIALVIGLSFWPSNAPEHEAYMVVPVLETAPRATGDQYGLTVTVRLPDGEVVNLTETEGLIGRSITETACVERRRFASSGEVQYRLRRPHRCQG